MKTLTLLRHAKSSWKDSSLQDRERPLNGRGQRDAPVMAERIKLDADIKEVIWKQLKTCYDPEIPINVVDLGLIYRCDVSPTADGQRSVSIDMTLTAPGCGMGEILVQDAQEKVAVIPTVADVHVELVFDPPWNQSMMSDEARLQTGLL